MRPTPEGKRFLLATFLIFIAAFNTGNNLIFLILAMMLSITAIAVALLDINLRGLSINVSAEKPAFANTRVRFSILIHNQKKFLPSYSLKIYMPEGLSGEGYIPHVPPLSEGRDSVSILLERRGIYRYDAFVLESSYPFILFRNRWKLHSKGEILVYPELRDINWGTPEAQASKNSSLPSGKGYGDDLYMIRDFRYGDDMRKVHWKASAKSAGLLVKEFRMLETKMVSLILDNIRPSAAASAGDLFEKAVSATAGAADRFINEGFYVSLVTCRTSIPFGAGREHLFKILDLLAVIDEQDSWECRMPQEIEGISILILKSHGSMLRDLMPQYDMVINASVL